VVPTYVVEGDPNRGIEPMAPDLKTPQDIRKYQDLFATPAIESKARLVTCIASWTWSATNRDKVKAYGLEDVVQLVDPGSSDALFASLESSYANREPWVGYIWGPSQPAAELDLTLLEEPVHSPECWETDKGCAYAIEKVRKAVHPEMTRRAPDVVDFLRQWHFDGPTQVEAEAYSGELGVTIENTAVWYLRNKEEQWTQWVTPETAEKVKEALQIK
jgi:glycine betaine/proline transport system substrate-binding protein